MTMVRGFTEEKKPIIAVSRRTAILFAIIVVSTMAVALAAGSIFGWVDFLKTYDNTTISQTAQDIMQNSMPVSWKVGDIVFTVQEQYADPHLAMISVEGRLDDGRQGLVCTDPFEPIGAYGENSAAVARRIGVDPSITWAEAAKELGLPLYCISALLNDVEYAYGEMMGDPMYNEDNSVSYFSMQPLNGKAASKAIQCKVCLMVKKVNIDDPEDDANVQVEYKDLLIDLQPIVSTGEYMIPENTKVQEMFELESIHADLTPSGLYFTAVLTALEGATQDQALGSLDQIELIQPNGEAYLSGISYSSGIYNLNYWPKIYVEKTISIDHVPNTIGLILPGMNETVLQLERKK